MKKNIGQPPGNSPLTHIPPDYCPPGTGFWLELPAGADRGKHIFYRDSVHGKGDAKAVIVLVHGNPECSYSYRKIIDNITRSISKPCRIVAMDHIGFGRSDQASFEMTAMDHAANLFLLIRHLDLRHVTLVVHDWGGPIGIGAFLREPERVANLVLLNTTVFPIPDTGYTYHKNYPIPCVPWSKFPSVTPDRLWGALIDYAIYRKPAGAFRIILDLGVHMLRSELGITAWTDRNAQMVYREQFRTRANARSSKRLVRQTAAWGTGSIYRDPKLGLRDTRGFYAFIQDKLSQAWGPQGRNIGARALIGRWDPLGKDEVIAQWIKHLPQLEGNVTIYEKAGHFVHIEQPEAIAGAVLDVAGLK